VMGRRDVVDVLRRATCSDSVLRDEGLGE
jgi:hypothetical protein